MKVLWAENRKGATPPLPKPDPPIIVGHEALPFVLFVSFVVLPLR
jgi:hypothetical protein